ncbi:MAG: hypothetical protein PHE51_09775 [Eubacteriales bacterium]|nr:hypothetical protein [Eubacteriales bacterium]
MALTAAEKKAIQAEASKTGKYVGKTWAEAEKEYRASQSKPASSSSSSGSSSSSSSRSDPFNSSGDKITVYKRSGTPIQVRADADIIYDDDGYFVGTRPSGSSSSSSSRSSSGSSSLDDAYKEQMKALRAQIQAGIAKAKGQYSNIISQAPQTYQPLRNQVSLGKEQQLQSLRESLANQGNRGGTGRQAMLGVNTAAENQLGDINLQQQNTINDANRGIADVEQQGQFQESQLTAELAAQKLRELLEQEQRAGEMEEDTRRWESEFELEKQELEDSKAAERLRNEVASIGAYSNDFMAEIQKRQGTETKEDDALIPYLTAARNEKIAAQLAQADNTANQAYKNAYELWKQLGVATEDIARILNIPVGSMTLDKIKADYSTAKPYYNPSSGGSNSGGYGLNW